MSKAVKTLMIRDYKTRFEGVNDAVLVSLRGVGGIETNRMRTALAKKNIKVTMVRNNLAKHAFKGTGLSGLEVVLTGSSSVAYGAESVVDVARELVDFAKKLDKLELRAAVLDGVLFEGKKGIEALSKFPTRKEALSQTVTLFLSPAQKLVGQVKGPGGKVLAIVKSVQEKLEKGETISKK
jgi:large subunit ribosomal protein L10